MTIPKGPPRRPARRGIFPLGLQAHGLALPVRRWPPPGTPHDRGRHNERISTLIRSPEAVNARFRCARPGGRPASGGALTRPRLWPPRLVRPPSAVGSRP